MKKRSAWINGVFVFASVSLFAGFSLAIVRQDESGLNCIQEPGNGGIFKVFFGTVFNDSTTTDLIVDCPMARLSNAGFNGLPIAEVFDRNTTKDVVCDVRSEYLSGGSLVSSSTTASSSGSGSAAQTLTFSPVPTYGTYHYFRCTIPPKQNGQVSHLIHMIINEN